MEILNRKARYDYQIIETLEAGIVLTGTEIKSIRKGSCNLKDSYIIIKNNETIIYIVNIKTRAKPGIEPGSHAPEA